MSWTLQKAIWLSVDTERIVGGIGQNGQHTVVGRNEDEAFVVLPGSGCGEGEDIEFSERRGGRDVGKFDDTATFAVQKFGSDGTGTRVINRVGPQHNSHGQCHQKRK